MILSFSHDKIWTDKGSEDTLHQPYFLIEDTGKEIPILKDVVSISDPFELESWVNWDRKVTVRRIYITHPSRTPSLSTEYYKLGFATFEQSVPYKIRVSSDLEANGKWPFDTKGEWIETTGFIYDIEQMINTGEIPCAGIGEFTIKFKGSYNLEKEEFDFDMQISDKCKVTQLLSSERHNELISIYRPFVDKLEKSHIIIGHNIIEYDNDQLYKRLKEYNEFTEFLRERTYMHQGFQRGRHAKTMVDIYPLSFDTLHAARFIWKDESEVGYGLKQLAKKYQIKVYECDEEGYQILDKPTKRMYENDFGGFGHWSNDNPICLKYNNHDIQETFGLFKLLAQPVFINMFISGLSFEDVVSGSNGRMADQMCLIRGFNKMINPSMMHPAKIAKALYGHFNGELKTKQEIFDYFKDHICNWDCVARFNTDDKIKKDEDEDEEELPDDAEGDTPDRLRDKLIRVVKYKDEMPDYVNYYPMLHSPYSKKEQQKDRRKVCYIAVGGKTVDPTEPLVPAHNVYKGDTAAQYPSIVKAMLITSDVVRLARKGEKVTGWCWFRIIYHKEILDLFEWKPASEFEQSDGEGYFIGYVHRGREGLLGYALTGIIKAVGVYKIKPGWNDSYQRTLKPMRNALTHGVMLALDATCQQYNIAGCAIPTYGQEITTYMNKHLEENGWKILETDTDGTEFRKIRGDAPDFIKLVEDVEQYWTERYNYPFIFDKELSDHKLFFAAKNYITIKKGVVKLTGNSLHAADKPKIAEKCMKALALEVLPITNSKEELIGKIHERAAPIVNAAFKVVTDEDLIMTQFIKPPKYYDSGEYRSRAEAVEIVLGKPILEPGTKIEFIVCEDRLPGTEGEKTLAHPLSFMWPKEIVDSQNKNKDISWYKDMTFSYIDTPFELGKVSSKLNMIPLFGFEQHNDDQDDQRIKIQSNKTNQKGLDGFSSDDSADAEKPPEIKKQQKLF